MHVGSGFVTHLFFTARRKVKSVLRRRLAATPGYDTLSCHENRFLILYHLNIINQVKSHRQTEFNQQTIY